MTGVLRVRGSRRARLVVLLALGLLTGPLAACSGAQSAPEVDVSGDAGKAPTVTYVAPLSVSSVYRKTIWPGTGAPLVEGGTVLFDFRLEDATDATLVSQTYDTAPETRELTREALGDDLYQTLRGQRAGARLLQVAPASSSGSANYPSVTVIDVLPLRASGTEVTPRTDIPAVTLAGDGTPTITTTGTSASTSAVTAPLIRGSGPQVGSQDTVTFQYAIFTWAGERVDSSWTSGRPVSQSILDLPTVLADAFVEQTVGSQLEIVVPPSEPLKITESSEYAGQTIVYVVDLLATRTPTGTQGSS